MPDTSDLNRGPYEPLTAEADTLDQINHVIEHLYDLPCLGCKDAVRLLQLFRAMIYPPPTEEAHEEEVAEFA